MTGDKVHKKRKAPRIAAALTPIAALPAVFQLESSVTIKDVEGIRRQLMAMFAEASRITVDVSRVDCIDTAGVQLLLAVRNESMTRGALVDFSGESAALARACLLLGIPSPARIAFSRE